MSRTSPTSFSRSLRGFLGSSAAGSLWADRASQLVRFRKTSRASSVDPVTSIDASFAAQNGFDPSDHLSGFNTFTRQMLANDVLDSLIQIQSEMSEPDDQVTSSALAATDAYRHTLAGLEAL